MIQELIDSALILPRLAATDKKGALDEILTAVVDAGLLDRKKDLAAERRQLLARESLGSTGIGNGIAVPHVKKSRVNRMSLVLAHAGGEGIDYEAIDGKPVHTIFMLLTPADRTEDHLQALRWISGLARNEDFRRFIAQSEDADAMRELLHEMTGDR